MPSSAGMAVPRRCGGEIGIETNIAELETFGFTVIPPDKTGAPKGFADKLYAKLLEMAQKE
ncbi:MAG: hypothetical protein R3C16_09425 [Hyphomonadaceae bacterium]